MSTITSIEGIGETYATKLRAVGIRITEALLKAGYSRRIISDMAKKN